VNVELNGTTLWYEQVGHGPPCLVIHGGLGVDHTLYRSLTPVSDELGLILYDQRNNGRSGHPSLDTLTMEQLADDAAALIAHLGHRRAVILGHSYGSFVAQELALRHPDVVKALVLVGASAGQLGTSERTDEDDSASPPPASVIEQLVASLSGNDELASVMRMVYGSYLRQADPAILEPYLEQSIYDQDTMVKSMQVLGTWSSFDRLDTIACPTVVLVGRHDPVTSWPEACRIAQRIPGARAVIFEDSGHMPWLDEPDPFFDTVRAWLKAKV
jgi:proline iminopeptidase